MPNRNVTRSGGNETSTRSEGHVAIGIDLGGTKILGGAATCDGSLRDIREVATSADGGEAVETQICALVGDLAKGRKIAHVTVGVPAAVTPEEGALSLSPNIDLLEGRPLWSGLADRLGCAVSLENDVNLAAYGEARRRKGEGAEPLAFLSFGTGVGLGVVAEGRIWRGRFGRAGEISYLPVGAEPFAAVSTAPAGIFEDQVGTQGFLRRGGVAYKSVREIFARAETGDAEAFAVIDAVARDAAVGLTAVQTLLDPAVIVLGGGIGVQELFVEAVRRQSVLLLPYETTIEAARLGPKAGMIGAVMMAAELAGFPDVKEEALDRVELPV